MTSFVVAIVFYTLVITAAVSGNNAAVTAVCTMSVLYFLTAVVYVTHTMLMQLIVDRLIHIKRGEWE